jgi:hypothetical protein
MEPTDWPRINTRRSAIVAFWFAVFVFANHFRVLLSISRLSRVHPYIHLAAIPQHWAQVATDAMLLILMLYFVVFMFRYRAGTERVYFELFLFAALIGSVRNYVAAPYDTGISWLEAASELAMIAVAAKIYQNICFTSQDVLNKEPAETSPTTD